MADNFSRNQQIINAFLHRNEREIESFYKSQWPLIKHLVRQMGGDESEAKDVMQQSFMLLYDKVRFGDYQNRPEANISTYFQRIGRYVMLNIRRSAHKTRERSINDMNVEAAALKTEIDLNLIDQHDSFMLVLNKLSEKCRELIRNFYWKDMNLDEIAQLFGYTYESAKNAKYRCLNKLKSLYAQLTNE